MKSQNKVDRKTFSSPFSPGVYCVRKIYVFYLIFQYKCLQTHTWSQIHKSLHEKLCKNRRRIIKLNSIILHNKHLVVACKKYSCTYSKSLHEERLCHFQLSTNNESLHITKWPQTGKFFIWIEQKKVQLVANNWG